MKTVNNTPSFVNELTVFCIGCSCSNLEMRVNESFYSLSNVGMTLYGINHYKTKVGFIVKILNHSKTNIGFAPFAPVYNVP